MPVLRKLLVGIAIVALSLTLEAPAHAETNRISGADRYSTSLAVAQTYFPDPTDVFIVTGKTFPDALAAGPLATVKEAPILLVGDRLNAQQSAYLSGLNHVNITILGGTAVVGAAVEAQLRKFGEVTRLYGETRYETAAKVAQAFGQSSTMYLATGTDFADALAGGAYAAAQAMPIMLTGPGSEALATTVARQLGAMQTVVFGGPGAVPDSALESLPSPSRIYGANRYETAAKIFDAQPGAEVFLASGANFPDALSIVPVAGMRRFPLLLARTNCSPVSPNVPVTFVGGTSVLGESADAPCAASPRRAAEALMTLPVKGRAPKTGYVRDIVFGPAWKDTDRNGCDTRNDVLGRDLVAKAYKDGTNKCVVLTGLLDDPYSGKEIAFQRGQATSAAVQIDHVVALSDAWQKGAQLLTQDQREQLANDPLNLLAVDGPLNQQKSDADAATWLPPNKAYRCDYVSRHIAVKRKYGLWVTEPEQRAMLGVLSTCADPLLPTDQDASQMKEDPNSDSVEALEPTTPDVPPQPSAGVEPVGNDCPTSAPIKGNRSSMKYHVPGGRYYAQTVPERCFSTEVDAQAAGFVKSLL